MRTKTIRTITLDEAKLLREYGYQDKCSSWYNLGELCRSKSTMDGYCINSDERICAPDLEIADRWLKKHTRHLFSTSHIGKIKSSVHHTEALKKVFEFMSIPYNDGMLDTFLISLLKFANSDMVGMTQIRKWVHDKQIKFVLSELEMIAFYYIKVDCATTISHQPDVILSSDLISRSDLLNQIDKSIKYYESINRFEYTSGLEKARYLIATAEDKEIKNHQNG